MKFKSAKIVKKICLVIKILYLARKFLYYNFILQPLFESAQHFYQKRKGSGAGFGAGSASGSVLVTNGSGCGSGSPIDIWILEFGSGTLLFCFFNC
jgi:hypothetical protein